MTKRTTWRCPRCRYRLTMHINVTADPTCTCGRGLRAVVMVEETPEMEQKT
jgi:hypothetical protein